MRFRGYATATFAILSVLLGITVSYAAPDSDIPPNNRLYRSLEKLAPSALIDSHLMGVRPIAGKEAARLLKEAREKLDELSVAGKVPPPGTLMIMEEMEKGIAGYGEDGVFYFKPLGSPEIEFIHLEGERSSIPGIKATQHSLIYNNEGIEPEEGFNAYFGFDVEGGAGRLSFYLRPLFSVDSDFESVLQNGYVRLGAGGLDMEVGKRSLWWGQGYHGGLFLTNNAEPLKMIRLTNPSPALLPWVFRYLGPFRFDLFASRLEEERAVAEPYFAGLRFDFKPHPVLEVGLTRTIIMGGDGRPGITPGRFLDVMFGENKVGGEELSNSIAGADFRLSFSFFQLYAEWGGEDEAGGYPSSDAYLAGLYLPLWGRDVDLRVEYADITNKAWYTHGRYSSGYTYKGRILGHHVGGGGRDFFVEMGIMKGNGLHGNINLDYEKRGVTTQAVIESHYQVGTEWEYRIGEVMSSWSVEIGLAYERIKNAGYTPGMDKDNGLVSVGITGAM